MTDITPTMRRAADIMHYGTKITYPRPKVL
jgi:hypothetical protein